MVFLANGINSETGAKEYRPMQFPQNENLVINPDARAGVESGLTVAASGYTVTRGTKTDLFSSSYFILTSGSTNDKYVDFSLKIPPDITTYRYLRLRVKQFGFGGIHTVGLWNNSRGVWASELVNVIPNKDYVITLPCRFEDRKQHSLRIVNSRAEPGEILLVDDVYMGGLSSTELEFEVVDGLTKTLDTGLVGSGLLNLAVAKGNKTLNVPISFNLPKDVASPVFASQVGDSIESASTGLSVEPTAVFKLTPNILFGSSSENVIFAAGAVNEGTNFIGRAMTWVSKDESVIFFSTRLRFNSSDGGNVYISLDSGESFSEVNSTFFGFGSTPTEIGSCWTSDDGRDIYITSSSGLYVSNNRGQSWSLKTTTNGLFNDYTRFVVGYGNAVYVLNGSSAGELRVSRSLDRGSSWSQIHQSLAITVPSQGHCYRMAVGPNNAIALSVGYQSTSDSYVGLWFCPGGNDTAFTRYSGAPWNTEGAITTRPSIGYVEGVGFVCGTAKFTNDPSSPTTVTSLTGELIVGANGDCIVAVQTSGPNRVIAIRPFANTTFIKSVVNGYSSIRPNNGFVRNNNLYMLYSPGGSGAVHSLLRYRLSQSLGLTISGNSAPYTTNGAPLPNSTIQHMARTPGGKYYVASGITSWGGGTYNRMLRLNADFSPDSSWYSNLGGAALSATSYFVAVQGDGKSIWGFSRDTTFNGSASRGYIRINEDGTVDTAYHTALTNGINTGTTVFGIGIQPSDGKAVFLGNFTQLNSNARNFIFRLNTDGTEDTSFYTNVGTGFGTGFTQSTPVVFQSDGKMLIGGNFTSFNSNTRNRLIRLNSDGTEDTSFYSNLGTGFNGLIHSIIIDALGGMIVTGAFTTLNSNTRNGIVRLNSDGTEDTSFYTNVGSGFENLSGGLVKSEFRNDGKLLVFTPAVATFNGVTTNGFTVLNLNGTEDRRYYENKINRTFGVRGLLNNPDNGMVVCYGFNMLMAPSTNVNIYSVDNKFNMTPQEESLIRIKI